MYKIKTFNKIDDEGLSKLPEDFVVSDEDDYDGIILRSYKMSEAEITDKLLAVARAGAGVNNIPVSTYSENGIIVFNTPGANANAVKEIVIAGALLSSRRIHDGINWAQGLSKDIDVAKAVEAGKADFGGPEILGKKVGVMDLVLSGFRSPTFFLKWEPKSMVMTLISQSNMPGSYPATSTVSTTSIGLLRTVTW